MAKSTQNILVRFRLLWISIIVLAFFVAIGVLLAKHFIQRSDITATDIPIIARETAVKPGGNFMTSYQGTPVIRLSAGQSQPAEVTPVPVVTGEPLSAEELKRILARLPGLESQPGDQADFRLAPEPLPPPRPGETIQEPFPAPEEPAAPELVATGPLEVLRYAPEGEIPVAPFISITFNQPMVPLGTLEALSLSEVPVQVEPALPGTWRWLGVKTLTFEYDSALIDRLPKATQYTVTIPAGTKSLSGGVLAQEVKWTFRTPPPIVVTTYPSEYQPQPLEPLFFIAFDQRIEPAAVLKTIEVTAGGKKMDLALASNAEIEANPEVKRLVKQTQEGRWLAFRATKPLPADSGVTVTIGPGTPSAEGPLVTEQAQTYFFNTYAPLRIEGHGCNWYEEPCPPLTPFYIRFNNPLDLDAVSEGMFRITPELPGAVVDIFDNTIQIKGASQGRTTYTVIVSKDVQDIFGQRLGQDARLTFWVGSAQPLLTASDKLFITLDPSDPKPALSVYTINYNRLDVKIYAVQPVDWTAFTTYLKEYQRTDRTPKMPGKLVFDQSVPVEGAADKLTEVRIDLSNLMEGKSGQFIVVVAPPRSFFQQEAERQYRTLHRWVQITQIGLDAYVDHSEMVAWTTSLKDGAPLSGVTIEAPNSAAVQTDENGIARFPIPDGAAYLTARKGEELAMLPASTYYWGGRVWRTRAVVDEYRWFVFDDRQMYRPGEEVHIKGWIRRIGGGQTGDVGLPGSAFTRLEYQVSDSQGNNLGSGSADINALGGFDFIFQIPQAVNLGYTRVYLRASGASYYHNFQIQEFRRPEFEVSARNETSGPYFAGEYAVVAVAARYYAGGALPNAEVNWTVTSSPSNYSPPNWQDFTFGVWQPWWWVYRDSGISSGEGRVDTFTGFTDANGEHFLRLDFDALGAPRPFSFLAEATVYDVNRQAWSSTTTLLVHPASLYVGLRSASYFVERGEPLKIEIIVTDLDGNPIADRPVKVTAARLEWKYRQGDWREEEVDVQECNIGSTTQPVTCTFETPLGGSYRIRAVVSDAQGRENLSQFDRWVSGGQRPPSRTVEQEEVILIPDKETYQPGEVAKILVQAPFSPAEGLLTVSRSGILYTQTFQLPEGSATLEVPIAAEHIPNLNLQVDIVGAATRLDDQGKPLPQVPPRPAYATAQLTLPIPPLQRTLSLEIQPQATELEPGETTTVDLSLRDAEGNAVEGAELAVVVVDEAILALTNYQMADPVGIFYANRPSEVTSYYARASILLADPLMFTQQAAEALQQVTLEKGVVVMDRGMVPEAPAAGMPTAIAESAAGVSPSEQSQPIRVRTDFNPLAVFAPDIRTDRQGKASVEVKLPDNLTRYRIMVVAVDAQGNRFGSGEANLTARLPLMVRPSAPRFLNFGDQFELPVVLQNQTDEALVVEVAVRASNIALVNGIEGSAGLRVNVPARDRIEVRFPAAAQLAGTARFQITAVSGRYADAAVVELPVYTPATSEAFATYGVVDEGAIAQPVAAPKDVFPQYGGLEITTSSTALQALTDAVLYLTSYPFECTEQIASRVLAVAALRDVLTAFQAEGLPSAAEMEAAVAQDIERLRGLQNWDGGFPYWRRGFDSIPFNTIHVAHALARAEQKGFKVPAETRQMALDYLRDIENRYPHWYSQQTRWTLTAYALYVRSLMGDRSPAEARSLIARAGLENLSLEAIGWLWSVLLDDPASSDTLASIRRYIGNRVVETAGAANFTTVYDEQTYLLLSSDRRTDAILLDALIGDNPDSDLIPKLVNGLLAHRKRGRWGNTQENVFVLLALDRYFNTFEAQTPDFVARIWLGNTYAGEHVYAGRTTERHETEIPMAYLVDASLGGGETQNLILSKEGEGRLYYRLGLRYAPTNLQLEPLDMGFVVQRTYEAVDDPQDVTRDEDGVWHIRAGARVRVRIQMAADNRRYHVALVDPLPAGLEILNPALAVSGSIPQDPTASNYRYGWWWWGTWYEHQNLRDERAEAFTSLLWDGVYEYTYIARATTPGTFVVPPAKAEEMYSPEVFGRSASDTVVVEDK